NLTADKGYDSEKNHEFARDEIGAFSIIPPRWYAPPYRTHGRYRKKLRMHFPYKLYHRRNMVETVNSVQKRKFGDELRSRLWYMRKKELKIIDIVYNVHRYLQMVTFVVIRGFLLYESIIMVLKLRNRCEL
ncbi:MAG: transposase, partial [Candidatus Micrarchaeota archaeon]|nr:transposase [Candidatus Micrarchaeota archaeon]